MRPDARPSAPIRSRRRSRSSAPSSNRTCTRAVRRSLDISTRVTTAPAARGSLSSVATSEATSTRTPSPTRRARVPGSAIRPCPFHAAHRHDLGLAIGQHGVAADFGKLRDLLKHGVADPGVCGYDADAEHRELVPILRFDFCDGNVETRAHTIAELLNHAPLVLERPRVRDVEREAEDADEQRGTVVVRAFV